MSSVSGGQALDLSAPRPYRLAGVARAFDYNSILHLLGKESDGAVARRIGCVRKDIQRLRTRLRIPPHNKFTRLEHLIGKVPDARLARRFGVSRNSVTRRRVALGLPPASLRQSNADQLLREYVAAINKELFS